MNPPPVQYATTSAGYSIAYAISGSGPPLVILPGAFEHAQLAWQYPGLQPWLEGLVQRFQVIQIDERGAGMSTRGLPDDLDFRDYLRDIEVVIEKLNPAPFVLLAFSTPRTKTAIEFAVDHPERVAALVLSGSDLGTAKRTALFQELPSEDWELFLYSLAPRDRTSEDARQTVELLKQAFTPQDFVRKMRVALSYPGDKLLSRLQTPTLVIHARDYVLGDATMATRTAQLAGAQMMLLDGSTIFGDAEQGIRAIEAFLAEIGPPTPSQSQRTDTLSAREIEVIRLIVAGRSNQQIAEELVISVNTVGRHVSNIFDKPCATNRVEAAAYAQRHGLV